LYAEKLAVKYSDFYIADSPVIQSYFRDKYGIESEYIAYGAELFGPASAAVLGEYGVRAGEYFLLMARMEPENNIEMILDGYAKSRTDMPILVVGDTVNKFSKHLREKFGTDNRVLFTGGIYDNWKTHCLKSFCRLYFHGHSTGGTNPSLLEAMASEAMIAAHDNVFNRQVLEEHALYFAGAEDITGLVDHLPTGLDAADMKRHNLEKIVQKFSWPDIIEKYERFILYSLSMQKNNERSILYRRYSG